MDVTPKLTDRQKEAREWQSFLWTIVGFGGGTALASPLILSIEPRERIMGGMIFGGVPLGILGFLYGRRRGARMSSPPSWRESMAGIMSGLAYFLMFIFAIYVACLFDDGPAVKGTMWAIIAVSGIGAPLLFWTARALKRQHHQVVAAAQAPASEFEQNRAT